MQALVIMIVKILDDASLGIGQVSKDGTVAQFEDLRFKAGPETFGLSRTREGVILAVALPGTTAAALRGPGLVAAQQLPVGVAAILPPASACTSRPGAVGWAQKARCKAVIINSSGMVAMMCQPTTCLLAIS